MVKAILRSVAFSFVAVACAAHLEAASLTVTWDQNPESNVTYTVYWGTTSGSYTSSAAAGTGLSYLVDDLAPGETYYFAVKATTSDGLESPYSDEVSATVPASGAAARLVRGDFTGSGKTDFTVFRKGKWLIKGFGAIAYGATTDIPVPGDYDGDGVMDIAVWRPSTGAWLVLKSSEDFSTASALKVTWGLRASTDVPVPADYDGDGKTDPAVFRSKTSVFYILLSSTGYSKTSALAVQLGSYAKHDLPVVGDYDGDGAADIAIWRPSTGTWYVLASSNDYAALESYQWGASTDIPVPADYDGDGITDIAIWRPATGGWYVLYSSQSYSKTNYLMVKWGLRSNGDVPVPGDFDGDGKADLAVWRPATGMWLALQSSAAFSTSNPLSVQWGNSGAGDTPATGAEALALSGLVSLK